MNIFQIFQGKNYTMYENMNFKIPHKVLPNTKKIHTIMESEGFVFA